MDIKILETIGYCFIILAIISMIGFVICFYYLVNNMHTIFDDIFKVISKISKTRVVKK